MNILILSVSQYFQEDWKTMKVKGLEHYLEQRKVLCKEEKYERTKKALCMIVTVTIKIWWFWAQRDSTVGRIISLHAAYWVLHMVLSVPPGIVSVYRSRKNPEHYWMWPQIKNKETKKNNKQNIPWYHQTLDYCF